MILTYLVDLFASILQYEVSTTRMFVKKRCDVIDVAPHGNPTIIVCGMLRHFF